MSKKLILGIVLSILIVIIGLTFGISTIVKFCKVQSIISNIKEDVAKDNYYIKIRTTYNGNITETETFYKEGIGKLVSESGVYTWTDGEKAYLIDENQKNAQKLSVEDDIQLLVTNTRLASLYPTVSKNVFQRFILMGNPGNKIKTVEEDGEKYTYIEIKEENYTKYYWLEKNRDILVKAKLELSSGEVYEYEYEIKYHATKLKDVELPDLSTYTVLEIGETSTEGIIKENNNEVSIKKALIYFKSFLCINTYYLLAQKF